MKAEETIEHLSPLNKIFFGVGDSTFSLLFTTLSFYFLFFLTDGVGISAALAGWIFFSGKLWDAVSDPVMGYISDRTETRWGRRRPYLLFGAVPLAVTYILLWQKYSINNEAVLFALYAVLAVIFFTSFTLVAVPYSSLIPELTLDYNDRTSLVSYRMMFSILLSIAGAALPMIFIKASGGSITEGFRKMALIFGAFSIIPLFITFLGTKERFSKEGSAQLSLKNAYRETVKNRPFRFAMFIFLLSWVTVDIIGVVFVYFVTYYLKRQGLLDTLFFTMFIIAAAFLPFWYFVSKKLGKRWTYILGISFWAVIMLVTIFLPRNTVNPVLIVMSALAGIGISTAHVIPWALVPECVDYDELKTGQRREGMYTGFLTFLQKLASSFAILITGWVLGLSGYKAGAEQTVRTLWSIRVLLGVVPCIMLFSSIVLAFFYPITRKRFTEIREELDLKNSLSARVLKEKS
ncbi:MAG: MFS transporter [Spirochaetales bacterium]|nr:MFS transporter [Spirochaetales bacterium]